MAIIRRFREICRVCGKNRLYVAGMRQQIYRNMGEMHANHVPILLGASVVKPQPVARHLDQTAKQETPFRPGDFSGQSFWSRSGGGCHNELSVLAADSDAVAQRDQDRV